MNTDRTIRDLAAVTGRHPDTLRKLARNGRLVGAYKLGGTWLVNREAFEEFRDGNANQSESKRSARAFVAVPRDPQLDFLEGKECPP